MKRLIHLSPTTLKLVLVALPMLFGLVYFLLVASDRYVSESTIAVRQASNDATGGLPGAALLLAGVTPPSREDTLYLQHYVRSLGLLQQLDAELGVRAHYSSSSGIDPLFSLPAHSSQEQFLEYYRSRVEVSFDELSSLLTIRVQAFDPAFAQKLNRAILQASERFVNENSHAIARERLRFAEVELGRASGLLEKAKAEVLGFQARNRLLDPRAQAQASVSIVAELEGSLVKLEAELSSLRTFLNDNTYQVRALRSRIDALRKQVEAERRRTTADDARGTRLNELTADFRALELRADFAQDAYKLALGAVENARIEASRKLKSLVVIEPSSLPQTAEYPRRAYNLATLLVVTLLLYAIVRLVLATVREHHD